MYTKDEKILEHLFLFNEQRKHITTELLLIQKLEFNFVMKQKMIIQEIKKKLLKDENLKDMH